MHGDFEFFRPLMAIGIVAVVVDENPGRAAFSEDAMDFANAARGIRPVVRRFDGDYALEKIRLPGNFVHAADDEDEIVVIETFLAGVAHHFIGNIHADDAALRHALRENAREPAGAAAGIENVVLRRDLHELERGLGDGPMIVLH